VGNHRPAASHGRRWLPCRPSSFMRPNGSRDEGHRARVTRSPAPPDVGAVEPPGTRCPSPCSPETGPGMNRWACARRRTWVPSPSSREALDSRDLRAVFALDGGINSMARPRHPATTTSRSAQSDAGHASAELSITIAGRPRDGREFPDITGTVCLGGDELLGLSPFPTARLEESSPFHPSAPTPLMFVPSQNPTRVFACVNVNPVPLGALIVKAPGPVVLLTNSFEYVPSGIWATQLADSVPVNSITPGP
jgi:hypothetical protein